MIRALGGKAALIAGGVFCFGLALGATHAEAQLPSHGFEILGALSLTDTQDSADADPPQETLLEEIPAAPLEGLEPAVQKQLADKRRQVEQLLADRADISDLLPAFGDLGQLYLLYDRPETAGACFRNVTRLVPGEPNAWYYLGVIHQEAGRFEDALVAFEQVLAKRPNDLPSLLRSGEILYQLRRLEEAQRFFLQAQKQAPEAASVSFGLGRVANAEKRFAEAAELFEKTLIAQPEADSVRHPLGLAYRRLGRIEEAKETLAQAGANTPIFDDPLMRRLFELSATSRSFFIEGNRARRRGLFPLAESRYRRALELDPQNASVHYNLGTLLGEIGRVDEAEKHFQLAVQHDPGYRDGHYNLAVSLRARGLLNEAAQSFRAVIELDPEDPGARVELAATLYAAGESDQGLRMWRQIADSELHDAELWLQLARYLLQAGQRQDGKDLLERAWQQAAEAEQRAQILLMRSELSLVEGRPEQAMEQLAQALEQAPANAEAATRLADLLCTRGRLQAAHNVLDRTVHAFGSYQPGLRPAAEALARLLATVEDPDLADPVRAMQLAEAIFEQRQGPVTAETVAMALAAQGRFSEAEQWQLRLVRQVAGGAPARVADRLRGNLERYRQGRRAQATCPAQGLEPNAGQAKKDPSR